MKNRIYHKKQPFMEKIMKTLIGMGAVLGFSFYFLFSTTEVIVDRLNYEDGLLYYQINVQDDQESINIDSLVLVIESEDVRHEISLNRGLNLGTIEIDSTLNYIISIVGSEGFGLKTWYTSTIQHGQIIINERIIGEFLWLNQKRKNL